MNDLISRKAAIYVLDEQIEQCNKSLSSFDISLKDEYAVKVERASLVAFRETLEYIPPAHPAPFGTINHAGSENPLSDGEIIPRLRDIQAHVGGSYAIDRAIELLTAPPEQHIDEWCTDCKEYDKEKHSCPRWNRVIRQTLADAQPQRTGHWIPVGMAEAVGGESAQWGSAIAYHKCSECDEQALCEFGQEVLSEWCPHCGAKMEGVSE